MDRLPPGVQLEESHYPSIAQFFTEAGPQSLFVYQHEGVTVASSAVPAGLSGSLHYFLREDGPALAYASDFDALVQWGSVSDSNTDGLQQLVNLVFLPLAGVTPWSTSIRHEFVSSVNRFMSAANDHEAAKSGKTLLFLPTEPLLPDSEPQTEDYIQRLETVVIHWTRQIKGLVNMHAQQVGQRLPPNRVQEHERKRERKKRLSSLGCSFFSSSSSFFLFVSLFPKECLTSTLDNCTWLNTPRICYRRSDPIPCDRLQGPASCAQFPQCMYVRRICRPFSIIIIINNK